MTSLNRDTNKDWEEKVKEIINDLHGCGYENRVNCVKGGDCCKLVDFISNLLAEKEEETVKRCIECRPKSKQNVSDTEFVQGYDNGFNQALNWWMDNIQALSLPDQEQLEIKEK